MAPLAAIDFAPATDHGGCSQSPTWVLAAASGFVVRSGQGVVVIDLDGDGFEQTGWNLLYLHIADKDRVPERTWVEVNDRIGHASCEGGASTGTPPAPCTQIQRRVGHSRRPHSVHARRLDRIAGASPYEGTLVNGDRTIIADPWDRPGP